MRVWQWVRVGVIVSGVRRVRAFAVVLRCSGIPSLNQQSFAHVVYVCTSSYTTAVHSTTQNSSDNLSYCPLNSRNCSDFICLRVVESQQNRAVSFKEPQSNWNLNCENI